MTVKINKIKDGLNSKKVKDAKQISNKTESILRGGIRKMVQ